jgi:ankyrin repeat protein
MPSTICWATQCLQTTSGVPNGCWSMARTPMVCTPIQSVPCAKRLLYLDMTRWPSYSLSTAPSSCPWRARLRFMPRACASIVNRHGSCSRITRSGSIEVVQLLVAHGADIDRPTKRYGGALGFASHFGRKEIARLLAPLSRDVHNLTYLGIKERLEQLFAGQPALVNAVHFRLGVTPLFTLPDAEDEALEMAEFLLAHGADAGLRNKNGITPDEAARKRGLTDAADLMRGSE